MATSTHKAELAKWRRRRVVMRKMVASGKSMAEIGRKYGISRQRVRQIIQGE